MDYLERSDLYKYRACEKIYLYFSQSVSNADECEQPTSTEPSIVTRKQVPSVDIRSNRKSMFEQSTAQNNAHAIERVILNVNFRFI
jgi:hypothetical protein